MKRIRAMLTSRVKKRVKEPLPARSVLRKLTSSRSLPTMSPMTKGALGKPRAFITHSQDAEPEGKINVGNVAVGRVGPEGAKNRHNGRHRPRSAHKKPDEPFPGIGADQYKKHPGKKEGHGNRAQPRRIRDRKTGLGLTP